MNSKLSLLPTILVVDDNDAIRTVIKIGLQGAGYNVVCATGSDPVVSTLKNGHFDLVITDVLMPGIDGAEVITAARVHQPNAGIMAMSGGGPFLTAEFCLKTAKALGAGAPLLKPFNLNELLAAVEKVLQRCPPRATG